MRKYHFLLIAAVLILYSVSLGHNFLFDEENVILRNPYIQSFQNIPQVFQGSFFTMAGTNQSPFLAYYRPLSILSFMVDYHFWKTDPMGYNATSLLIQLLLVLAFFELLRRILKNDTAAFFAALVYAVHPIHTEAVGHVSCRSETFAALFLVCAILCYLTDRRKWIFLFMVLGFLAKESSVLIPVFLSAADLSFFKGRAKERLKRLWPFFILSAAYVLMRKLGFPIPMDIAAEHASDRLLRVFSLAPAFARYVETLVLPPYFQLFGSIAWAKNWRDPRVTFTAFMLAGLFWVWTDAWRRKAKASFFAITLFLVGLAPFTHIVHFYPEWAEHYLTVPALGLSVIAGLFFRAILETKNKTLRISSMLAALLWIGCLGIRTYERNTLYNNLNTYYEVLSKSNSPYAVHGYQERAKLLMADNHFEEAKRVLVEAKKTGLNDDVTLSLLGACEMNLRRYESALEAYKDAARLQPGIPQYAKEVAGVLVQLKRYDEAVTIYENLKQTYPEDYTLIRLGMSALELSGKPEAARDWGEKALERFKKQKFEAAAIAHSLVRLSFRQGWTERLHQALKDYLPRYGSVPWHGPAMKLYSKQIDFNDFINYSRREFPGFMEEAFGVALVAAVIQDDKAELRAILSDPAFDAEAWAAKDLLSKQELELAEAA